MAEINPIYIHAAEVEYQTVKFFLNVSHEI